MNAAVYSFYTPWMHLHNKLGFLKEGQLGSIIFTKGFYYGGICYGIARQEFDMEHAAYLRL